MHPICDNHPATKRVAYYRVHAFYDLIVIPMSNTYTVSYRRLVAICYTTSNCDLRLEKSIGFH